MTPVGRLHNGPPQSEACDECRGLPEEMSHVLQALRRNYAGAAGGLGMVPSSSWRGLRGVSTVGCSLALALLP